jgi:hypothetical protein
MKKYLSLAALCLMAYGALAQKSVHLNGSGIYTGSYISLGNDSGLNTENFTVECWFKRTDVGFATPTGYGGVYGIPLVAKGRAQAEVDSSTLDVDGDLRDMNYFLGIDVNGILVADFEEISSGTDPGLNHTISGVTAVQNDLWYHACATYDGSTFNLYLNGKLETSAFVGRIPNYLSTQYAAIGTAMGSDGLAEGRFNGDIDNVRIWNYARTQASIRDSMFVELTAAPGLLGSYKLNEGTGTTAGNTGSAGTSADGLLVDGASWVAGTDLSRSNSAVKFDGLNDYVDLGASTSIGATNFTLECWFKKTGNGTTGAFSPFTAVYPLVAKGRDEETGTTKDCNYFLGLLSTGEIAANFEEVLTGEKHSIVGVTPVLNNIWYHASATYDGVRWKLYLNGELENTDSVGRIPQSGSIQHASLGSALNSGGAPEGFFEGFIDNARIWNYARSPQSIVDSMGMSLSAAPGLLANYNLNDAYGDSVRNSGSAGSSVDGRLSLGAVWADKGIIFNNGLDTFDNVVNDSNWYNPSNWSNGEIPYAFRNAFIPAGKKVVLDGQKGQCKNITNNGTLVVKNTATISVWGSLNNLGTINCATGAVNISGSGSDSISGNPILARHLAMNKFGTGDMIFKSDITIDSFLSLNNGIIYSPAASNLVIRDNAGSSEGSHQSHVDGFMTKIGDDAFIFPLGDIGYWARLGISAPSTTTDAFVANRVYAPYVNLSNKQNPLKAVSSYEHWNLSRTAGLSAVQVTLFWEDNVVSSISAVSDTDLVVAHWTGSAWVSEAQDSRTGNLNRGSITSQLVSSFSPFTFGATTSLTALPIELLDFKARKQDGSVKIIWTTISETQNAHFIVEKSIDGQSWKELGRLKGSIQTSQLTNYEMYDHAPAAGMQYYRLKQVDMDGGHAYSKIEAVNFGQQENLVNIYPNPASGILNVDLGSNDAADVSLILYNSMGQEVYSVRNAEGTSFSINLSEFGPGIYLLEIVQDGITSKTKVFKY